MKTRYIAYTDKRRNANPLEMDNKCRSSPFARSVISAVLTPAALGLVAKWYATTRKSVSPSFSARPSVLTGRKDDSGDTDAQQTDLQLRRGDLIQLLVEPETTGEITHAEDEQCVG